MEEPEKKMEEEKEAYTMRKIVPPLIRSFMGFSGITGQACGD